MHELTGVDLGVVFLDRVISKMGELVGQLAGVVILQTKPHVELGIVPYLRWVVILHDHPLADVELTLVYY